MKIKYFLVGTRGGTEGERMRPSQSVLDLLDDFVSAVASNSELCGKLMQYPWHTLAKLIHTVKHTDAEVCGK